MSNIISSSILNNVRDIEILVDDNDGSIPADGIKENASKILSLTNNPRIIETINFMLDEMDMNNDDPDFYRMMMNVVKEEV